MGVENSRYNGCRELKFVKQPKKTPNGCDIIVINLVSFHLYFLYDVFVLYVQKMQPKLIQC